MPKRTDIHTVLINRRGAHRHRPGLRVRLFRRPGLQGAARRGFIAGPGELQPGHDHDRSRPGRRHLYRADHAGIRGEDHRPRAAQRTPRPRLRAAADHGRADRAQHRALAQEARHAGEIRHRADRRAGRRHRQGGRPRAVPPGDDEDRAGRAQGHHAEGRAAPQEGPVRRVPLRRAQQPDHGASGGNRRRG